MSTITKQQVTDIRRNCGWNEDIKEEWVQWVTGDKTITSLKVLTFEQADKILKQQTGVTSDKSKFQRFDINNSQHKYILSLCHTVGWTKNKDGKIIADMEAFGHWLQTRSPIKLPLPDMGTKQIQKVIYAFEKVVKHQFE
jgi:hypothetical protein